MTRHISAHEARSHLSRLLDDVQRGEDVVIDRRGHAVARLTQAPTEEPRRVNTNIETTYVTTSSTMQASNTGPDPGLDEYIDHFWF